MPSEKKTPPKQKSAENKNSIKEGNRFPTTKSGKIKNSVYEKELFKLQLELVKLQEWIKQEGLNKQPCWNKCPFQ